MLAAFQAMSSHLIAQPGDHANAARVCPPAAAGIMACHMPFD
jgi:hypothetical protein